MKQYLDLLRKVLTNGENRSDRTGTGTMSIFGSQMEFDLRDGFPLVTTKKVHLKSIIYELLWMLKGETNVKYLQENGVRIWNEWADERGELGPVYGEQWRRLWTSDSHGYCHEVDQLGKAIWQIKNEPTSRRIIVTAWNPGQVDEMALPPCHCFFQFFVSVDGRLHLHLYQRSADLFLGVPFNIASYALLDMMVAQVCGLNPGKLVYTTGDTHIYLNHIEQVELQLTREPRELPEMILNPDVKHIDGFKYEDFTLEGYAPWPKIEGKVSV